MTGEKKYKGIKVQVLGIAILIIGIFLMTIEELSSRPLTEGYIRPFMIPAIILIIVGIVIIAYGVIRKD